MSANPAMHHTWRLTEDELDVAFGRVRSEPYCGSAAIRASVERGDALAVVSGRAMLSQVGAGTAESAAHLAFLAASADHPVTDDPGSPDDQVGVVVADTDGQDADAVEHVRQSRLSRWQSPPVR